MATIAQMPQRQPQPQHPAPPQQAPSSVAPWPLFDLCLDVPHPACSSSCPPPFLIGSPVVDPSLAEELPKNVPQIARFAFPEFDESQQQQQQQQPTANNSTAAPPAPLPLLNKYDQYAMQPKAFQNFTFSMQLSTGVRMYGHVRRYLPPHLVARTRYDVGRRGERALVILTRASGADQLYSAILKSVEAITSQQAALPRELQAHKEPKKWFLHSLFMYQQHLAKVYATKPAEERGKPLIASLDGLELGTYPRYKNVDSNRFIIPTSLLHRSSATEASQSSSILPLLRCVGVAHALRIMAALLSERRVVMVSSSPTRLATCSHAALAMLATGLLHWQHLYIPVLPTHLWPYLAAPYPYLIGILSANNNATRLDQTDGLGDVLIIQLDSNTMETRGISSDIVQQHLPDLFQNQDVQHQLAGSSASEFLAQDLVELLKVDKRSLYGESTLTNMGETAAKATKALKGQFMKFRDKGRQFLQNQRSGTGSEDEPAGNESSNNEVVAEDKSMAPDYIYTEGCHNEVGEEEARVSFTTFFLCLFGNMRWYLTAAQGQEPQLDRERYLQQRRSMGDGEGSTMWPLLKNFCQTQMLEEFAKARIEEVRTRAPVTPDAPLFLQCANYHRQHSIDFGILSVRRVARQVAESSPSRLTGLLQTNARRMAMTLTSNKAYEGDFSQAIAQLVEQCREGTSVLFDVMSVIWLRMRDCKGLQWKHGYQALQLLKNLLYHGPMAVIAEATDGLDKIRAMKYYDNNLRSQSVQQVRTAAQNVYNLLVDRSKLFFIRRVCADRRQKLQDRNAPKLMRDNRLNVTLPFRNIHAAMHPNAGATIARIPPAAPSQASSTMQRERPGSLHGNTPPRAHAPPPTTKPPPEADMFGLFDSMTVASPAPAASVPHHHTPPNTGAAGNPFDTTVDAAPTSAPPPSPAQGYQPQPAQRQQQVPMQQPQQSPAQYVQPPQHFPGQAPHQPGYPRTPQVQAPPSPQQAQQQFHQNQPGGYQQQQQQQPPPYQQQQPAPQQHQYQQQHQQQHQQHQQQQPHQQPNPYQQQPQQQQQPQNQQQPPQGQGGNAQTHATQQQARAQFDPFS